MGSNGLGEYSTLMRGVYKIVLFHFHFSKHERRRTKEHERRSESERYHCTSKARQREVFHVHAHAHIGSPFPSANLHVPLVLGFTRERKLKVTGHPIWSNLSATTLWILDPSMDLLVSSGVLGHFGVRIHVCNWSWRYPP